MDDGAEFARTHGLRRTRRLTCSRRVPSLHRIPSFSSLTEAEKDIIRRELTRRQIRTSDFDIRVAATP